MQQQRLHRATYAPTPASLGADRTLDGKVKIKEVVSAGIERGESSVKLNEMMRARKSGQSDVEEDAAMLAAIEARSGAAAYLLQFEGQSGASIIYTKLLEYGVTVVNGFCGGAVLPLLDEFHEDHPRHDGIDEPPIRWITNSNEASAGYIAEGYAKSGALSNGKPPVGVCVATSGPAVTNLITPLQDAKCDGVPIMAFCGQVTTAAPKDAFQSSPAVDLTRPCTKWSYQITSPAEVPLVMDYAFFVTRNGRPGPVFIDLPKDLQSQIVTSEMIDHFVDAKNTGNENTFSRWVKARRSNGEIFQALCLGTDGNSLLFVVYRDDKTGTYKLRSVTESPNPRDVYHADHHPTNRVIQTDQGEGPLDADSDASKNLLLMIQEATKPVIIAGQGCNDAPEELKAFAETLQIPVTTTLHALGCFDERHELALNMLGMHGHATPNYMVQESDLVVCIGSRFDDRITGRMSDFVPEARRAEKEGRGGVVHVDLRLSENCKQLEPTFFVHSTGKKFLQTMNEILGMMPAASVKPKTAQWLERKKELQLKFPVRIPEFPTKRVTVERDHGKDITVARTSMSAQSVVAELDRQLVQSGKIDDCIFATGVGVHQLVAAQFITWTRPRQILSSGSLGTMGVALGYCIGAKLANPDKMCIGVDGDGSFNMTFTELKTLAEQDIPIKMMILDNDGQMMVEYWQRLFHGNRLIAVRNNANPDYTKLAEAFRINALYCDAQEDLEEKMRQFIFDDPDKAVVFHVHIQRTPCLPMVSPGRPLDDMILEDVDVDGSVAAQVSGDGLEHGMTNGLS